MKTIDIKSNNLKTFKMDMESAFKMLAVLIAEYPGTRFWFGSTNGSIAGEVELNINGAEWCKTINDYPEFNENNRWNGNFHKLDELKKNELIDEYLREKISPHEKFMLEFGNELKKI